MKTYLLLLLVIAVFGVLSKATEEIDDSDYASLRDAIHNALDTEEDIIERDLDVEKSTSKRGQKCTKNFCSGKGNKRKCFKKQVSCK